MEHSSFVSPRKPKGEAQTSLSASHPLQAVTADTEGQSRAGRRKHLYEAWACCQLDQPGQRCTWGFAAAGRQGRTSSLSLRECR